MAPRYNVITMIMTTLFCMCTGGSVTAGLGIYDTMQYIMPPISTWCIGQASSAGSLLLCAGTAGMRHSLPNSRVMIHQPSGQAAVRWIPNLPLPVVVAQVLWSAAAVCCRQMPLLKLCTSASYYHAASYSEAGKGTWCIFCTERVRITTVA